MSHRGSERRYSGGVTLRMGDAIYPGNLPAGLDAYAGYDSGNWPDFPTIAGAHPGVPVLEITPWAQAKGACLDIETGDATADQFPLWWLNRCFAGVYRPVAYASISLMPNVVGYCNNAKIARADYRLWSAHYTGTPHICGPTSCGYPVQCDGTQWIDHGGWDESLLAADFFALPTPTPPPPAPAPPVQVGTPTPIPGQAGLMNVDWSFTTGTDGTGYASLPIPAGCTKIVACSADVLDPATFKPPHHDVDVDQTDPAGIRDSSGVVVQPVVGSNTPGHQSIRLVGGAPSHFYTGHAIFC